MASNPRKRLAESSWETPEVPKRGHNPDELTFRDFINYLNRIRRMRYSDFRQYIHTVKDINTWELSILYNAIDHEKQQILLEEADVEVAAKTFDSLDLQARSQYIAYRQLSEARMAMFLFLSDERRREIANTWDSMVRDEQVGYLDRLSRRSYAVSGYPSRIIMTGGLPKNYPLSMDTCNHCGNRYAKWDALIILRCGKHTQCSMCAPDHFDGHVCYPNSAY
jgi:hypothetical protein